MFQRQQFVSLQRFAAVGVLQRKLHTVPDGSIRGITTEYGVGIVFHPADNTQCQPQCFGAMLQCCLQLTVAVTIGNGGNLHQRAHSGGGTLLLLLRLFQPRNITHRPQCVGLPIAAVKQRYCQFDVNFTAVVAQGSQFAYYPQFVADPRGRIAGHRLLRHFPIARWRQDFVDVTAEYLIALKTEYARCCRIPGGNAAIQMG